MSKKHQYRICINHLNHAGGSGAGDETVEFEFTSHDDLFNIIDGLKGRSDMDPEAAAPLALGIKLFGSVMLANRSNGLFADLFPHFSRFMKGLKGKKA